MHEKEKLRFRNAQGYELNLENPRSFNEKIVYRKLFDRRPILVLTADKYKAREYIRERIGWEAENHFVPFLDVVKDPNDLRLNYNGEYIIKSNDGAGEWIFREKTRYLVNKQCIEYKNLTKEQIVRICMEWIKEDYSLRWNEWAYHEVKSLILVEKLLRCSDGNLPSDFRVCMFGGKCRMIYVTTPWQATFNYYDEEWKPMNVIRPGHGVGEIIKKPKNFNKMIEFAEKLSKGWDFMRPDFYIIDDKIYFGELTHYPGAGLGKLPRELDFRMGEYWK